jgi:NADH dehydrogenase
MFKNGSTFCAVTGAFGYSGKYIARRLADSGLRVMALTNSPRSGPLPDGIERVGPLAFEQPDALARSLEGVQVLFNTYWVRFNHRRFTHAQAVRNSQTLFECARRAGVRRIVHVSITNPSANSTLSYFSGKAAVEVALQATGIPHTILRPAVLFGHEDILINNIAWALRRFPFFAIFGDGRYRLQPIHVEDFARLAVEAAHADRNEIVNATGPETFAYGELVDAIGRIIGRPRPRVSVPPSLGYLAALPIAWWKRDVFITRDEIRGLMANLLWVNTPPTGTTLLTEWAKLNAADLGRVYAGELARRK